MDFFTVFLFRPNSRAFTCHYSCARGLPVIFEKGENSHRLHEHNVYCNEGIHQPIFRSANYKRRTQANWRSVSIPTDSPTASRLELCNSLVWVIRSRAPSQYPKWRLSVRSRKVSKPRDLYLELSDRFEIWQALRQQCCRCACQIAKRYDNLKYRSRGFETLRDLTERRLFGYWDGALLPVIWCEFV